MNRKFSLILISLILLFSTLFSNITIQDEINKFDNTGLNQDLYIENPTKIESPPNTNAELIPIVEIIDTSNIITPPSDFSEFSIQENVGYISDWQVSTTPELSFETPEFYTNISNEIQIQITNKTIYEDIVAPFVTGGNIDTLHAQSFEIPEKRFLTSFDIYVDNNQQDSFPQMEIRSDSPSGTLIHTFTPHISATGWFKLELFPHLIINSGNYCLIMEASDSNEKSWQKREPNVNLTNTWENTMGTWVSSNYDIALKVYTSDIINLVDDSIYIVNSPIIPSGEGYGMVNINSSIETYPFTLDITNGSDYRFVYQYNASIFWNYSSNANITFENNYNSWYLNININKEQLPYLNYYCDISGFQPDHENIQLLFNEVSIGFTRIGNKIRFFESIEEIKFTSENYIKSISFPSEILINQTVPFNIETFSQGLINFSVFANDILTFSDQFEINESYNYYWFANQTYSSQNITCEVSFFGENQYGYQEFSLNILDFGRFQIQPSFQSIALSNLSLSCDFIDSWTESHVHNVSINYSLEDQLGTLVEASDHNYETAIDLNTYSLLPGIYSVNLWAEKLNYQRSYINSSINIQKRSLDFSLTQDSHEIFPGNSLKFYLTLHDEVTKGSLIRPVDLEIKVFNSNLASEIAIFNEEFLGITSQMIFEVDTSTTIEPGDYNIVITAKSSYYENELTINDAIHIKSSIIWYLIGGAVFIGLTIVPRIFYKTQQSKTRKSLLGVDILHDNGIPIAEVFRGTLRNIDPVLISGGLTGILNFFHEFTGGHIRTISIDAGYIQLIKRENYWIVVITRRNPIWIKPIIRKFKKAIDRQMLNINPSNGGKQTDFELEAIVEKFFTFENNLENQTSSDLTQTTQNSATEFEQ